MNLLKTGAWKQKLKEIENEFMRMVNEGIRSVALGDFV